MDEQELKQTWIDTLRTGEHNGKTYKQGKARLNRPGTNKYCCLGVLCDLIDPNKWVTLDGKNFWGEESEFANSQSWSSIPDEYHPSWLDVKRSLSGVEDDAMDILVTLNDKKHYTFEQIADWVEENL